MKISRNITSSVNWVLDNLCPPILRDCYIFMFPIYHFVCGEPTAKLLKYKDYYPLLSQEEYAEFYSLAAKTRLSERPSDLNRESLRFIVSNATGTCLDAGCGRGYLAELLAEKGHSVTGVDICPPKETGRYTFIESFLENLPFSDESFDTVTCCHVLEHVQDMDKVMTELIRVTKKKLLIVLPRQREYRFVADLHIRFFPYEYNVRMHIPIQSAVIKRLGCDWGIYIDKTTL